jgi:hypothetical protein
MTIKLNKYLKLVIIGAVSCCSLEVNGQFRVFATPSLEIPMVFSRDPGYNPTFGFKLGGFYETRRLSLGLSVGYQSFSSNEGSVKKVGLSSFQLDDDPTNAFSSSFFGSITGERSCNTCTFTEEFGDLTMIPILIEWNQYLLKMDKLKISAGLNVGLRIYSYSHVITFDEPLVKLGYDPRALPSTQPEMIDGTITTDKTDTRFNVSPKIAFEYLFNDKFSLYIEPTINIQTEALGEFLMVDDGFNDSFFGISSYTPNSYTVDQMFTSSIGIGIIYNFGHPAKIQKRIEDTEKIMESEKIEWLPE